MKFSTPEPRLVILRNYSQERVPTTPVSTSRPRHALQVCTLSLSETKSMLGSMELRAQQR